MMRSGMSSLAVIALFTDPLAQALGVVVSPHAGHETAFASFMEVQGRTYEPGSHEYEERLALFATRIQQVHEHNSRPNLRWTAGINSFADRTEEERAVVRGWRGAASPTGGRGSGMSVGRGASFLSRGGRAATLPSEFTNWTSLSTLTPVRDQGGCGSCWAVTAGTVLDAHAEIYAATPASASAGPKFSVQQLVSCVPNPHKCGGSGGCDGATVELAFAYVTKHGLQTAQQEPYLGVTGACKNAAGAFAQVPSQSEGEEEDLSAPGLHTAPANAPGRRIGMVGWSRLPENKYEPLMRALVEHGPVGVSVAAGEWFSYQQGVFDGCHKDAVIDHAVTLVAYGVDKAGPHPLKFWEIQNSWGPDWGEHGKIRLLRRDDEQEWCGTDNQPEVGTACAGGPKKVTVCGACGILYDSSVPHFGTI
mmetsp:Transcript_10806/g.28912  ORF Transcript_10806/g.28912 Transcript_10806/m.28912 type:complete len:420 (-) Transcript_10806:240-1499(-)